MVVVGPGPIGGKYEIGPNGEKYEIDWTGGEYANVSDWTDATARFDLVDLVAARNA